MNTPESDETGGRRPLRLWPGVVIGVAVALLRFVAPVLVPEAMRVGVLAGAGGGLAVAAWWLLFSRAPWSERLGGVALMAGALFATSRLVHESIAKGTMGMLFYILALPILGLAFVAWAVATRRLPDAQRRAAMVATVLAVCGAFTLLRSGGITANFDNDLHWRWTPTPEERLLAQGAGEAAVAPAREPAAPVSAAPQAPTAALSSPAARAPEKGAGARPAPAEAAPPTAAPEPMPAEWPGFRGPARDGVVAGARIETDWSAHPPTELWRRPVGPGWSSFAVAGELLYTQEQRGEDEVVACYRLKTGHPVWKHRDPVRFWESNAGAGPRATPSLGHGRVYAFGATGILNALDARDGSLAWSRDAAADIGKKVPYWGFAGSPLLLDDLVIVAAAGTLAAYDAATGQPRWTGPSGGAGYSSPHLSTIGGVRQVLLLDGAGASAVRPEDGALLWKHAWSGDGIVQPALTAGGDVLLGAGSGMGTGAVGMRRVAVAHGSGGWTTEERWTSSGLKPYFNDFVVHEGHAFGFDGRLLSCVDLEDGRRKWKGGRYGQGQLVLLKEQGLLLVLSEEGELALVKASPDGFAELARVPALEGKTWNHPVLVGELLLVRNSEEMAAFRLPRLERSARR